MTQLSFVTDWKTSFLEIVSEKSLLSNGHQFVERNFIPRLIVLFVCCLSTPGKELFRFIPRGRAFLGLGAIYTYGLVSACLSLLFAEKGVKKLTLFLVDS